MCEVICTISPCMGFFAVFRIGSTGFTYIKRKDTKYSKGRKIRDKALLERTELLLQDFYIRLDQGHNLSDNWAGKVFIHTFVLCPTDFF